MKNTANLTSIEIELVRDCLRTELSDHETNIRLVIIHEIKPGTESEYEVSATLVDYIGEQYESAVGLRHGSPLDGEDEFVLEW